jgi:hypothetical protein
MRGAGIDEGTLDRLLQGRILPDDAPPGYSDVASILVAAASPASPQELRLQAQHVPAAGDAIGRRTRRLRPGPLGLAMGLVLISALLLLPGLAVAHVLPDPAQHAVTTMLEKIGITVPANTTHPTPKPTPAVSPSLGGHPASTGSEISSIATTTDATGVAKGAEISTVASGGKSKAGQHGKASTAPHGPPPKAPKAEGADRSPGHGPTGNGAEHASSRAVGGSAHP